MHKLIIGIVMIALAGTARAQDPGQLFDWVWQTAHESFYEPKLNGVDWPGMKAKYRTRVTQASSREERASIINEMLAELRTSHTQLYTPDTRNTFSCLIWTAKPRSGELETYPSCWMKPVVLLVNQGSRSGKELLSYAFKRGRLGPIVGTRTAGAVTAGTIFANEADASLLYLATKDIILDDGTRLEGSGVRPDIEVPFNLLLAQGQDAQKNRAIAEAARHKKQVARRETWNGSRLSTSSKDSFGIVLQRAHAVRG